MDRAHWGLWRGQSGQVLLILEIKTATGCQGMGCELCRPGLLDTASGRAHWPPVCHSSAHHPGHGSVSCPKLTVCYTGGPHS